MNRSHGMLGPLFRASSTKVMSLRPRNLVFRWTTVGVLVTLSFGLAAVTLFAQNTGSVVYTDNILYRFTNGSDGGEPDSRLVASPSGSFYGTTSGGSGACQNGYGCGVVFELKKTPEGGWTENRPLRVQGWQRWI